MQDLANPDYQQRINTLNGQTGAAQETGFSQDVNGSFTPETNVSSNGHSITITPTNTMVGIMHTHLNDVTRDINGDGIPDKETRIRIFSPRDVITFITLLKRSIHSASQVNFKDVYLTMISSSGNYQIKWSGNEQGIINLPNSFNENQLKTKFKAFTKNGTGNLERGFLKLLRNEFNINDISLFRVEPDNSIVEKTLSSNGRTVQSSQPCNPTN